jgi:hypothetical protein
VWTVLSWAYVASRLSCQRRRAAAHPEAPFPSIEAVTLVNEAGGEFAFAAALPKRRLAAVCIAGPLVERRYARKTGQIPHTLDHRLRQVVVHLAFRERTT